MVYHMVDPVPALLYLTAKADLYSMFRHRLQPDLAAGEPVVGKFALPAVVQLLLEDAVLKQDTVPGGGVPVGGQTVQIAGSQPPQAAVAQTGVGFALVQVLQLYLMALKGLLKDLHQTQVVKVVLQAAAHEELHRKVVDLLLALGVVFRVAALALGPQKVPKHHGAGPVILLVKGVFRLHRHFGAKLCYNLLVNRVLGYNITNQTHFCDTPFFEEK